MSKEDKTIKKISEELGKLVELFPYSLLLCLERSVDKVLEEGNSDYRYKQIQGYLIEIDNLESLKEQKKWQEIGENTISLVKNNLDLFKQK